MTLEEALDVVLTEVEWLHEGRKPDGGYVTAMRMVEDAVLRYIKIQKEFDKLQEILKEKDQLNGASSIVIEDDNVRSES
ncbi:uncharacterized protein METZ01_LOCUS279940 [marine metagenome]|uniref:Uncharacterized protein n=1 Tax=marine metagenome TaxID=408172 RepID=A0A382KS00_9ZZZZ